MKARDFSSVVHYNKFSNGTYVILNRPAYHPDTRATDNFGGEISFFFIDIFVVSLRY